MCGATSTTARLRHRFTPRCYDRHSDLVRRRLVVVVVVVVAHRGVARRSAALRGPASHPRRPRRRGARAPRLHVGRLGGALRSGDPRRGNLGLGPLFPPTHERITQKAKEEDVARAEGHGHDEVRNGHSDRHHRKGVDINHGRGDGDWRSGDMRAGIRR